MQTKGRYHDRRQNKRRHAARRCNARRRNVRLNVSSEVSLRDQDYKSINISESGVYLEVKKNDTEDFSPGTIIPVQITTVTKTPGSPERKFKLGGRGTVIRNCIIENPGHENSFGVALEFTEKLNIIEDSS